MHFERTGRTEHETREVPDVTECSGCGGILAAPHATSSHRGCHCNPHRRHIAWWCFDCHTWTYDPPCTDPTRTQGSAYG